MRRVLPLVAAVLGLAAPASASAQSTTPLRASLTSCATTAHSAVFTGSMPTVRGTRIMAMRFDLQRLAADGTWRTVKVPGLGVYKRSSPGQTGFVFNQRVQALAAPGQYRAFVRFRWYAPSGSVLKHTTRATPVCAQPDPRPDLRAGGLTMYPATDGRTARYALVVANTGRADAGPFAVDIAGARAQVASLARGTSTTVAVDAPVCSGADPVAIVLDPLGQVDEADEADDSVQRPCPLS